MKSTAAMLVACLAVLAAQSARGADPGPPDTAPSIEVTGNGEVILDPDRATLTVAIETQGTSSAAAAAENARLTTAVTDALLTAGATRADIKTANYAVLPQWKYPSDGPPKRVGYEARNSMRVSVSQLALLGKWMDAALGAGASRVENIEFGTSGASTARLEALAKAVADARLEAETLAKAAGGHLGPLQRLSTTPAAGPQPLMQEFAVSAQRRQTGETHIEPSPLHIAVVVTARWRFLP